MAAPPARPDKAAAAKNESGFSFGDFLDIINPLQHIPVVSTIYREITGDECGPVANILGGALFGGLIGLASSAVDAVVEMATGEHIGEHVLSALGLHDEKKASVQIAETTTPQAVPQAQPVPAFLIAEAEADRARQAKSDQAKSLQAQNNVTVSTDSNAGEPTAFWRSLQRGGGAAQHGKMVVTIGPPRGHASPVATDMGPANPAYLGAFPSAPPAASAPAAVFSVDDGAKGDSGAPKPLPQAAIPEMMMQALAKYEAMHKAPQAKAIDQIH